MRAWVVRSPAPIDAGPLEAVELPDPDPGPGEVRLRVTTCGVCRTDLHVAEGDLPPRRSPVVPGHEVVGIVDAVGPDVARGQDSSGAVGPDVASRRVTAGAAAGGRFAVGDRIGVAWLRATCGACRPCRRGAENLCFDPRFTGWTDDGGYAEHAVVPAAYAYRLPDGFDDEHAAPLLCAGIIGYRALRRSGFQPGDRLGIWGFGGSAHLTAQVALSMGAEVHVVTRGAAGRRLAGQLGATWVGRPGERPPVPLDAAISFAPAGEVVPEALAALDRGGVLALAGIHVTTIPALHYQDHLFQERELRSVTANTRADGEAFLALAGRIGLRLETVPYPFDRADQALADLAHDRFAGAAVLHVAA
jgi:alcohol dehydrogenase, propanol-preferring